MARRGSAGTEVAEEVTEVTDETVNENGEAGPKRRMPVYTKDFSEVESFAEIPEAPKFIRKTRGDHYFRMLSEAQTEKPVGEWFVLATFHTPNGANQAKKGLTGFTKRSGEVVEPTTRIPSEGDWEFGVRPTLIDPDGPATSDNRGSELWARHNS